MSYCYKHDTPYLKSCHICDKQEAANKDDEIERLRTENAELRKELDVGKAFHKLTISERDWERFNSDQLKAENAELRARVLDGYILNLKEVLDMCETDPTYLECFKPQLKKLYELLNR